MSRPISNRELKALGITKHAAETEQKPPERKKSIRSVRKSRSPKAKAQAPKTQAPAPKARVLEWLEGQASDASVPHNDSEGLKPPEQSAIQQSASIPSDSNQPQHQTPVWGNVLQARSTGDLCSEARGNATPNGLLFSFMTHMI